MSVSSCFRAGADYTGDRRAEIAVFRPSTGQWFIRAVTVVEYGQQGDIP